MITKGFGQPIVGPNLGEIVSPETSGSGRDPNDDDPAQAEDKGQKIKVGRQRRAKNVDDVANPGTIAPNSSRIACRRYRTGQAITLRISNRLPNKNNRLE